MSYGWAMKQKTIDREMMSDVLADMDFKSPKEKTDLAPKSYDRPKQSVSKKIHATVLTVKELPARSWLPLDPPKQNVVQNFRPAVLTVKEPPARGWLPRVVFASVVLFALSWFGLHSDMGKRFMALWHGTSPAEKSSVVTTPAPVSLDPAEPAGPGNFSPGLSSEAPIDDKNPGVPQNGGAPSTLSSREPN